MKMKEACRATALTERAIRLYLAKQLLSPEHRNGMLDFSTDDIRALKDISVLRQHDFSIEQIGAMLRDPATIPDILLHRMDEAASDADHNQAVYHALKALEATPFHSASELAARLNEQHALSPELRFGQFDEISEEARRLEAEAAQQALHRMENQRRIRKPLLVAGAIFLVLLGITAVFLSQTRVAGFLPLSPITVIDIHPNDRVTVSVDDPWAADVLGQSSVTVPFYTFGAPLTEGDVIDRGSQLAVELTNFDLLRLGISPLQAFRARSEEVNTAWTRTMLRALFAAPNPPHARLWIREVSNLPPLLTPPAPRTP